MSSADLSSIITSIVLWTQIITSHVYYNKEAYWFIKIYRIVAQNCVYCCVYYFIKLGAF